MESIVLNVSGSQFVITKRMIRENLNYANTNNNTVFDSLFKYVEYKELFYMPNNNRKLPQGVYYCNNEFFVQRSPYLFDIILQYCQTGKLHIPNYICKELVRNELQFWRVDLKNFCSCCRNDWEIVDDRALTKNPLQRRDSASVEIPKTKFGRFRYNLWRVVENENSLVGSMFAWLSLLFIVLSTMNLILATMPGLQNCPKNGTDNIIVSDYCGLDGDDGNDTDAELYLPFNDTCQPAAIYEYPSFFSRCSGTRTFEQIEAVCVIWFTMELLLRALASRNLWKFAKDPLNIIDVLATLPYYLELILWLVTVDVFRIRRISRVLVFLRTMRTLRVLRVLKLARYVEELRVLGGAILSAKRELGMLVVFVLVSLLIFGTLLYYLERDVPDTLYTSIPASCWWSVVTLTTVGYGDVTPKTLGGKIVGSVACVAGVLVIALPVTVLVEHFDNVYKEAKQRRQLTTAANSKDKNNNKKHSSTNFFSLKKEANYGSNSRLVKIRAVVNKKFSRFSKTLPITRFSNAPAESNFTHQNGNVLQMEQF